MRACAVGPVAVSLEETIASYISIFLKQVSSILVIALERRGIVDF